MKPCLVLHGLPNLVDCYMTIEIYDNFLIDSEYKLLHSQITGADFPWFFNKGKVTETDNLIQYTHTFYNGINGHSNYLSFLKPIYKKLNINAPLKIKANTTFGLPNKVQSGFHVDGVGQDLTHRKTAIFYLSDTNGPTVFKDPKQEVECKQNRLVKFDAHHEHAGVLHEGDPSSRRIVINFNYY